MSNTDTALEYHRKTGNALVIALRRKAKQQPLVVIPLIVKVSLLWLKTLML